MLQLLLLLLLGATLGLCDLEWAQPTGYLAASHRKSVRHRFGCVMTGATSTWSVLMTKTTQDTCAGPNESSLLFSGHTCPQQQKEGMAARQRTQ